jgi:hypothetical protein
MLLGIETCARRFPKKNTNIRDHVNARPPGSIVSPEAA